MNKYIPTAFVTLAFITIALPASEPTDLVKLRESWQRAVQQATAPIDKKYIEALAALKLRYTKDGKLEDAISVDSELKQLTPGAGANGLAPTGTQEKTHHKWQMLTRSDFAGAKRQAETAKGRLPILKTEGDQKSFINFYGKAAPGGAAWLDAHFDDASQKWVWGDGTPITYFNWSEREPVMTKGAGIEVLGKTGKWRATTPGRALDTVTDTGK